MYMIVKIIGVKLKTIFVYKIINYTKKIPIGIQNSILYVSNLSLDINAEPANIKFKSFKIRKSLHNFINL